MTEEPLEPDTPWRRDLHEIEPALSAWALARFAEPVAVANVASPGNGMSSESVLFDVHNVAEGGVDHYVARLAPLPDLYPVFPDYNLEVQRKCMDLVRADTDVPAPEVAFFERDTEWLRTPFLVMRRIEGEAPPDIPPYVFGGWVMDATEEQRRKLQDTSVERARAPARDHAEDARPLVPRCSPSTARARWTSSSATSAGTTSGRATACRIP